MTTLYPVLNPRYFHPASGPRTTLPFPFTATRTRFYYFARNGIWEGLTLLGLRPGDEVLMPAFTSGIEVDVVVAYGLTPIFYALKRNLAPDFSDVHEKLSSRTKLFYAIHYLGFPQPLDEIVHFCQLNKIFLFEDAALSFLSADKNAVPLGSTGDVAIFCPRKSVPIPHGGILVVNNPSLPFPPSPLRHPSRYATIRQVVALVVNTLAAQHNGSVGETLGKWLKYKMIPFMRTRIAHAGLHPVECGDFSFDPAYADWGMATLSRSMLSRFDYELIKKQRRENYELLAELLRGMPGIALCYPHLPPHTCPMDMMVLVSSPHAVIKKLAQKGIETSHLWFEERTRQVGASFPKTREILARHLVLPIHHDLTPSRIRRIADAMRHAVSP